MTVKIDLRPLGVKIAERKKVDLPRVIAIALILVFIVTSCFTSVYGIFVLRELVARRQALEASVEKLTLEGKRLDGYIAQNKEKLDLYEKALSLLREDIPSVEFFLPLWHPCPTKSGFPKFGWSRAELTSKVMPSRKTMSPPLL